MGPRKPLRKIFLAAVLAVGAVVTPVGERDNSVELPTSSSVSALEASPETETRMRIDHRGNKFWYNAADQLDRLDGPATEYTDGTKHWYRYGVLHRTDGPAIEHTYGDNRWFVRGLEMTEMEFRTFQAQQKILDAGKALGL